MRGSIRQNPDLPEDNSVRIHEGEPSDAREDVRAAREPEDMPLSGPEAVAAPAGSVDDESVTAAADRVRRMEELYDRLSAAAGDAPAPADTEEELRETARILAEYYDGGGWQRDYERDEQGLFPAELKRGVLSQDGLYDLLCEPWVTALQD